MRFYSEFFIGLLGITPIGAVSYISILYGGTTSDEAILNMDGPEGLID